MKKRILGLVMALAMALSLLPSAALAAGTFTDVPQGAWYAGDVQKAVDMKLVNGVGDNKFNPNGLLTYSEVVQLAACMHQKYFFGSVTLTNGSPWYSTYVDYAKANGIITKDYNWTQTVTRAGYMEIFSRALPDTALPVINNVPDGSIPDVAMTHPQAAAIYKLYKAGIVQGTNQQYYCSPASSITRCEVAAILVRMMDSTARVHFSLGPVSTPLTITSQPKDATVNEGGTCSFSVAATGGKTPYTYQWYKVPSSGSLVLLADTGPYSGTKTATMTFSGIPAIDDGAKIYCEVKDADGKTATSKQAVLTVKAAAPLTITEQPDDMVYPENGDMAFFIKVSGGKAPYTYQWYKDGWALSETKDVFNTKTDGLNIDNLPMAWSGSHFYCIVTDADGNTVKSREALLTVTPDTKS